MYRQVALADGFLTAGEWHVSAQTGRWLTVGRTSDVVGALVHDLAQATFPAGARVVGVIATASPD